MVRICCCYIVSRKSLLKSRKKSPTFRMNSSKENTMFCCSCKVGGGINTENAAEYLEAGLGHLNCCYTPGSSNIAGWKIHHFEDVHPRSLTVDGWKTFGLSFGARPSF